MAYENNNFIGNYGDENGIRNQQIPTSAIPQPPRYEEVNKTPFIIDIPGIPPPQYFQNIQPLANAYPIPQVVVQPLPQPQTQLFGVEAGRLKHEKLHLIYGALSLVFGIIIVILDPLLPAMFRYHYSMFPAGLFMIISGICSIHGSRKRNECSLKASLTFNIFALILVFVGYVMGLVAAGGSYYYYYNYNFNYNNYYYYGFKGLGVFNTIFGTILFVIVLWDSTLKCGTLCCKTRLPSQVVYLATSQHVMTNIHVNQ